MAYYSLRAYDADVWLDRFVGLQQSDPTTNGEIRYAAEALNVETPKGVLQPHAGYELLEGEFTDRVETLARFTRRWYSGTGSNEWLVCAAGGKLYSMQEGTNIGWVEIPLPEAVDAYQSNVWSWVTYELNEAGSDNPIDVLLMSNAEDGMIMVIPPDRPANWGDALETTWANDEDETWEDDYSPKWTIRSVTTQNKKFGVIARYMERVWGGAIPGDPDMLMYSRPYDPTDWTAAGEDEQPEEGAGSVQQPSWDGDSFTALRPFGNQLIAFKEHRVWRIVGTDPGEYVFSEQYGGGAAYPNTIAVDVERILMACEDGLNIYDGMSVTPWGREQAKKIWETVNRNAMDQMCAALFKRRYYIAFPVGDSPVNNALLIYNQEENTVLYYQDVHIESMLATYERLYATSSSLPGRVLELKYDSWECGKSSGSETRWVSPWMDFGLKSMQKGGFELYFTPEVQNEAVTLRFTIETEKKAKTKSYTIEPTMREHRAKRLHFSGAGRRFRIIIETEPGNKAPWRLIGGLQLKVETDPD